MRSDEIRALTDADLSARVNELEEERFRLRFRAATEALEDPLRLRVIRKDIARRIRKEIADELDLPASAGIATVKELGLVPIKINAVLMRGFNDGEVDDFIELTRDPVEGD